MKPLVLLVLGTLFLGVAGRAADSASGPLKSGVYRWEDMTVQDVPNGQRRAVLDGSTATLGRLHCHITTLKPGERSGPPRLHQQEEVIIVKEGQVEADYDGHKEVAGPGSVIFFAAHATTALKNAGAAPATYIVINYFPRASG